VAKVVRGMSPCQWTWCLVSPGQVTWCLVSELRESGVRWLTSPGGSLLWDFALQAAGILFTVVILQRYFEHREAMRWRPARQHLYYQLFDDANWLVGLGPREHQEELPDVWYRFGYTSYGTKELDKSFAKKLSALHVSALHGHVTSFADQPELLDSFKRELDTHLEHSAAIFLAREPELNRLIGQLREHISHFEGSLEIYREARASGKDPAARLGSSAIDQAGITLKEVIISAYQLRSWLAEHADSVDPHPTG
jgi:hypothetical protein